MPENSTESEIPTDKDSSIVTGAGSPEPSAEPEVSSILPAEVAEVVGKLPEPIRKSMELSIVSMMQGGPRMGHPLVEKFTPEHITKFLDYSHEETKRQLTLRSSNRWFTLAFILICLIFFGFLIVFLADQHSAILLDILKVLTGFLGGLGGGYGLKAYLDHKSED